MFKTELNNDNFDFLKTCRLCLNQTKELFSIFDISSLEIQYLIIINECTSLKISINDNLPKNICLECVDCLNKFYKFRKLVANSELCLNDYLNKFWNNSNKVAMLENTSNIEEIESKNEPTCSISVKTEKDPLAFEDEDSKIESKIEIVKDELAIVEHNPTITEQTSIKSSFDESDNSYVLTTAHKSLQFSKCKIRGKNLTSTKAPKLHLENCVSQSNKEVSTTSPQVAKRKKLGNKSKKSLTCMICGKSFSLLCNLKRHEKIHTGEKPYVCNQCNKAFGEKSKLKRHERIHTGEKPYCCKQCDLSFIHLGQLRIHEKFHSGVQPKKLPNKSEKPLICMICGNTFSLLCNLKRHEKIHTGEKPFVCKYCNKAFGEKTKLKRHERIHTGERLYSCKECDLSFIHLGQLRTHEKFHSGEKSFNCQVCGKSFIYSAALKQHSRVHTGEKPFICKQCGKCFTQSSSLGTHKKLHLGN